MTPIGRGQNRGIKFPRDTKFPQTTPILPSLPVKNSVLRQLGIADSELPHGLVRLKQNLLLSPSHTPSQESNICANSGSSGSGGEDLSELGEDISEFGEDISELSDDEDIPEVRLIGELEDISEPSDDEGISEFSDDEDLLELTDDKHILELNDRLDDIIAEPPIASRGPDPDIDYKSKNETFKSMSYLDQIAFVCLAGGLHDCQAPDCLQYREKLEGVVPVCHSWPGLRKWVLCITSCTLRTMRDANTELMLDNANDSKDGLFACHLSESELPRRLRTHLTACIMLTTDPRTTANLCWDEKFIMLESVTIANTAHESGSIGDPKPDQTVDCSMISTWEPPPPPVPRPDIYTQTFDPLKEGSTAGPSVDVAEVFQLVAWFRNLAKNDDGEGGALYAPVWHHRDFTPVASKAVGEAAEKLSKLEFCQQRVWEVVRHGQDGVLGLVPFVGALEYLPQLRHDHHTSCTSGFCEYATLNFTSVAQLHKCPAKKCVLTTNEMFNQNHLVEALKSNTMTTAWTLDGMSLVAQGKRYIAVSHVWSDGTGVGAWKAGQVNKCLWDFWVKIAGDLGCDGVWWDTVCIPQDKKARSDALNNMHQNYAVAKYTVVHDLYLADIEWKNDGSPCIALVLSPWFTRGWTALELLLSRRVFVLFRKGDGYTLKDLDKEILAQNRFLDSHAHWIATDAVKRLRRTTNTFVDVGEVLSVLQARFTSWRRDQSIIAGLMCGLTDHVGLSEQDITKRILSKVGEIRINSLFHGLPTMSDPGFSWCPHRFVDIPSGGESAVLDIYADGTVRGDWEIWYIPSKTYIDGRDIIWPLSTDMCVQAQVRWALQEPEKCVILTRDSYDSQGLLVRLKAYNDRSQGDILYCKYIGVVNFSPREMRQHRICKERDVSIGYLPGMVDVGVGDLEWNDKE